MKDLLIFYLRRYLKRDIILLGIFAMAVILIAAIFRHQFRSAVGLGGVHHKMVQCWILWNATYTFLTTFNSYRKIDTSYETMLLPFSVNSKFIFTAIRVLIIIPIVSSFLMIVLDDGLCGLLRVSDSIIAHASSICTTLTYSGYIMHRLPIMPFYLFMFTTLAMCLKTVERKRMSLFISIALLFGVGISIYGPHNNFGDFNYPFVSGTVSESIQNTVSNIKFKSTISEIVSWTMLNARMQRMVGYIYLLLLPISFLILTYLRFKELEAEQ